MKFPTLADPDRTRFCYLRLRRLKEAIKDPRVMAAVARELDVPEADVPAIRARMDELRAAAGSFWNGVEQPEIWAASMFKARSFAADAIDEYFRPVSSVQDLAKPLTEWLLLAGLSAQAGPVPRTGRANLIGHRPGGAIASPRIMGIEVTNDPAEIAASVADKSIDNTHVAYIACTLATAAGFLWLRSTQSGRWDGEALQRELQPSGRGLLLVEGDAIAEAIPAKERKPDKALLQQLAVDLQGARRT